MKKFFGPKRHFPDILWNQNEPLLVPSLSKSACDLNLTYPTFFFTVKQISTKFHLLGSFFFTDYFYI